MSAMSVSGESVNRDLMTYKVSCLPMATSPALLDCSGLLEYSAAFIIKARTSRLHECTDH